MVKSALEMSVLWPDLMTSFGRKCLFSAVRKDCSIEEGVYMEWQCIGFLRPRMTSGLAVLLARKCFFHFHERQKLGENLQISLSRKLKFS